MLVHVLEWKGVHDIRFLVIGFGSMGKRRIRLLKQFIKNEGFLEGYRNFLWVRSVLMAEGEIFAVEFFWITGTFNKVPPFCSKIERNHTSCSTWKNL